MAAIRVGRIALTALWVAEVLAGLFAVIEFVVAHSERRRSSVGSA